MAGPWEQYRSAAEPEGGAGPWTRYSAAGSEPDEPRQSAPPAQPAPRAEPPVKPPSTPFGFMTGNVNLGISDLLGLPADTVRNALNLGIAGYGYARGGGEAHRTRGGEPYVPPDLIEPGPLSQPWWENLMRRGGMVTPQADPESTAGRYGAAGLRALPSAALGRVTAQQAPRAVGAQATAGMSGELAADVGGEEYRGVGTMLPSGRRLAKPPDAAGRARTERQAERFDTARGMGIPVPPRAMVRNVPRDRMEDVTAQDLGMPAGTELTPKLLRGYISQQHTDGYDPLAKAPQLAQGVRPNAAFQTALQDLGQEISAGQANLPTTFKASGPALRLLGEYGYATLPGNAKATIPPRQQPIPADVAIRAIKKLRNDASTNFASDKPEQKTLATVQKGIANALEQLIDDNLAASGNQQLLQGYRDARTRIAKANDVLEEIDPLTGKLSASRAARAQADRPMSGAIKDVSDVAREFPGAMKPPRDGELFTQRVTPMAVQHPGAMAAHWSTRMWDPVTTSDPYQRFIVSPRSRLSPEQLQMLRLLTAASSGRNRDEIPAPPQ